ncbi:pyrroline-5-carboxylate reductase [Bacillus sp. 2205SS5-2]|uniref:pyrroline-5-carboxylate reductase n=1 Tax=Bacillus sp. 2205SS5-2 TaxID=3109031 RepID=UPI003005B27A
MNKRIGFIGCGNMAKAMMGGMIRSEIVDPSDIMVSAKSDLTIQRVTEDFNVKSTKENVEVAQFADMLFIAVKPNQYEGVLKEIKSAIQDQIIVTMAAGITTMKIEELVGKETKIVRTMPNTPSLVGEGMTAFCTANLLPSEKQEIVLLLTSFGKSEEVEEVLMDSIPAVAGSSPAYVFMMIEALADGGVLQGLNRKQAYQLAAQAVYGAAKMVLETNIHPAALKDQVCSPGGATIEAVSTLEKEGFRGAILAAMEECGRKTSELGN